MRSRLHERESVDPFSASKFTFTRKKFAYFEGLIRQKQKETDDQFDEGRRLMLTP